MKILIIGGTGLISTAISEQLLAAGHDITLYNRGQTASRVPDGAKILHGDRNDFAQFEAQMAAAERFDVVIDIICFRHDQAESLIRAFSGRTTQLVFCSTVDVYSKPAHRHPVVEDESRNSLSDYGRNKARCEDILLQAHTDGHFNVTIIRPAHTYGESRGLTNPMGGWRTTYLDRLRKGKPVIVHGDGNTFWVSCHADDVGRAFVNACLNEAAYGKVYHTTGEVWRTWNQWAYEVAAAMGAPEPTLVHIPSDLLYRIAPERCSITYLNLQYSNIFDNSAAKRDLGFEITVSFEEGVQRAVKWLDENGKMASSDDDLLHENIIAAWEKLSAAMVEACQPYDGGNEPV